MKIDQISNQYYDASGNKDFYKGTSFRVFKWAEGMTYYNDERYVDWVMMNGGLCVCKQTHVSDQYNCPEGFYIKSNEKLSVYDHEIGLPVAMAENDYWEFFGGAYHAGLDVDNIDATQINFEYIDTPQTYGLRSSGASSKTIQVNISNDWGRTWKPAGTFTTGNNISAFKSDDDTLVLDIDGNETHVDVSKTQVRVQNGILQQSVDKGNTWSDKGKVTTKVVAGTVDVETVGPDQSASLQVDITDDNVLNMSIAIPAGAKGEKGDKGDAGQQGAQGLPGKDGTWTQFIYCLSTITPDNPTPSGELSNNVDYQNDQYLPAGWSFNHYDPVGLEMVYYCTRTKWVDGIWGPYEGPHKASSLVTINDFVDLHASFTAFAFTRSEKDLSNINPYGGVNSVIEDYEGKKHGPWPCPTVLEDGDIIIWEDSVPEGTGPIWMTTKVFTSEEIYTDIICDDHETVVWSNPVKMVDQWNFQLEFSKKDNPIPPQHLQSYYNADPLNYEAAWHAENPDWFDEDGLSGGTSDDGDQNPSAAGAKWMATCKMHDGIWTDWTVMQIKGEDGNDGQPLNILGTKTDAEAKELNCDSTVYKIGDAYIVTVDGANSYIIVYSGDDDNCWHSVDYAKGTRLHMKFADLDWNEVPDKTNYSTHDDGYWIGFTREGNYSAGEAPGKYCGTYIDENEDDSMDPNKYAWGPWKGQDGWGYEFIYALSTVSGFDKAKYTEEAWKGVIDLWRTRYNYNADNFIKSNNGDIEGAGLVWYDDPQSINVEYPYCYVSQRRKDPINGWEDFSYPVLWSSINDLKRGYDIETLYYADTVNTIDDVATKVSDMYDFLKNSGKNPDTFTDIDLKSLYINNTNNGWQNFYPVTHNYSSLGNTPTEGTYYLKDMIIYSTSTTYSPSNQKWSEWSQPICIKNREEETANNVKIPIHVELYSNNFSSLDNAKTYLPNVFRIVINESDKGDDKFLWTITDIDANLGQINYSFINESEEGKEDGIREQISFKMNDSANIQWHFLRPKFIRGNIIVKLECTIFVNSTGSTSGTFAWTVKDDTYDTEKLLNSFNSVEESDVYLSQLMGVKNGAEQDAKVVAGIYGGGNGEYNDKEGVTLEGSKLMMFAGSESIDTIGTAAFRVYDNGDTYIDNLYARGFIYKQAQEREVKTSNTFIWADAAKKPYEAICSNITLPNVGAILPVTLTAPYQKIHIWKNCNAIISLPFYFSDMEDSPLNFDDAVQYIGQTIIIKCDMETGSTVQLPYNFGSGDVPIRSCPDAIFTINTSCLIQVNYKAYSDQIDGYFAIWPQVKYFTIPK